MDQSANQKPSFYLIDSSLQIALVPYTRGMIKQYHQWLEDPYIQEMTATGETSLEEEIKNQESYLEDKEKYIFIILDLSLPWNVEDKYIDEIKEKTGGMGKMGGDINLFLNRNSDNDKEGELNVMIAEKDCQRKGLAQKSILLMMNFGIQILNLSSFIAKISTHNKPSIELFEKKLGFSKFKEIQAFEEVHYSIEASKVEKVELNLEQLKK